MTDAQEAPQSGALSIDQAVALLDRRDADEPDDARSELLQNDDFAGAASAPEEADERAEDPDDGEDEAEAEEAEGDVDRLAAPKYWSKEAKARFAELDPELQAVVLSQEGPREEAAAKAKAETRTVRDEALRHVAEASELLEALAETLPEAYRQWHDRWAGTPDWAAIAQTHGPDAANQLRAQYAQEQARLSRAEAAAQAASQARARFHAAREMAALQQLDPDLLDPDQGVARRGEIVRYLADKGVAAADIQGVSALEVHLARKAMLWDRAQARAQSSAAPPRPAAPATRPLARGGASSGPVDPKARRAAQAKSRFSRSRSIEDAVALLNAQGD